MAKTPYDIGYGKPPKHTRFKAGKSGNPKGRPKGSRNFFNLANHMLSSSMRVKIDGKIKNMTTVEAALLRLKEKALAGDPKVLAQILDLAKEVEAHQQTKDASVTLHKKDHEILRDYLQRNRSKETGNE